MKVKEDPCVTLGKKATGVDSSGNAPITFKETESTRSDKRWPKVHESAIMKAKCPLCQS